jgi:hypothetical protein
MRRQARPNWDGQGIQKACLKNNEGFVRVWQWGVVLVLKEKQVRNRGLKAGVDVCDCGASD